MDTAEIWVEDSLLAFDGTVLEVFGFPGSESIRFHVRNLNVSLTDPDRKGRRTLTLKPRTRGAGGCALEVREEDWPSVEPLVERVRASLTE